MNGKPILFSTEMVRAILEGRKTQTRRVVKDVIGYDGSLEYRGPLKSDYYLKPQYKKQYKESPNLFHDFLGRRPRELNPIPVKSKYQKGDLLWVRETFLISTLMESTSDYKKPGDKEIHYKATPGCLPIDKVRYPWKPSIFMPKKYARIWLEVVNVRVERVRDISQGDALSEGASVVDSELVYPGYSKRCEYMRSKGLKPPVGPSPAERFKYLWDSINQKRGYGWEMNPWVWVIEFKLIRREI